LLFISIVCLFSYNSIILPLPVALATTNSSSKTAGDKDFMQEFFGDVEIVKGNIGAIVDATRKISEINQNVTQATSNEKEREFSHDLEPLVKATNKKATIAKQLLQRLREDTERLKTSKSGSSQSAEIRIRENLANTLTRKFVDVMKDYQNAQTKFKTEIKKKVQRQVQIAKKDATAEEIDAVFRNGGGAGQVLKDAILSVRFYFIFQCPCIFVCDYLSLLLCCTN
jgi:t-SNARE complex subunit (syntaxin)